MSEFPNPSIQTHVPVIEELPRADDVGQLSGRPDLPTPSLWQKSVKVKHKASGKPAIVVKVDYGTMMFRAFFPTETGAHGEQGRFSERTEWYHCRDWDVEVTFSQAELDRQAARRVLEDEIAKLKPESVGIAAVLCDDPDPAKNLAKLKVLVKIGTLKTSATPEVLAAAVAETKATKKG